MRAERLLQEMMLLQARGQMAARELAAELGVTVRTIYRDMEALQAAGVPLYSVSGRGGGYGLVDSYRTSLTGLTEGERQALFMLSVPAPLEVLGLGASLQGALRKLAAALPGSRRAEEEQVRQRFYLDATWWRQGTAPVPHLQTVQDAVWQDRQLRIRYRLPAGVDVEYTVAPYGLVAKAGVWYLVYAHGGRVRALAVSALLAVTPGAGSFARPADFDLARFWQAWCAAREAEEVAYTVEVRVRPAFLPFLPPVFGVAPDAAGPADGQGWHPLTLSFESLAAARARLLGCGRTVEVLAPEALRVSIADFAEQIAALYGG
ncbi:MAG: WYL domain-containing protein [Anaerolineae bacterium]|nr:WYL domain-containing protein [Anaerolineae bacterium]